MRELVHERDLTITDVNGALYDRVRVYADLQETGRWGGIIEFAAADGASTVQTGRETTQTTAGDVARWALGLEPIYFEGAIDRAVPRVAAPPVTPASGAPQWRAAFVEVASADPGLPMLVMDTRTLAPGWRRVVHEGGALVYEGTLQTPTADEPGRFAFVAQFRSENGAALVANVLWSGLYTRAESLTIDDAAVAIDNAAIKDALLRGAQDAAA
jgi:hypothetical protein